MIRLFIFILVLPATGYSQNRGTAIAKKLCVSMERPSDRSQCHNLVATHFFDRQATKSCAKLKSKTFQIRCLKAIAGYQYNRKADLANCMYKPNEFKKLRCLKAVSSRQAKSMAGSTSNGNNFSICESLNFSSEKLRCVEFMRGKAFDSAALKLCGKESFASSKMKCLETIAGRTYQPTELNICKGMLTSSRKMECLSGRKSSSPQLASSAVQGMGKGKKAGYQEALSICESHFRGSDKNDCLNIVRDKKFQPGAVELCAGLFQTTDKNNCLRIVADKKYKDAELSICKGMFRTSEKLTCLEGGKIRGGKRKGSVSSAKEFLNQALKHLRKGKVGKAEVKINAALEELN